MAPPAFTFSQLTPTSFLRRSGSAFRERMAIVDGPRHFTYGEFLLRSQQLAGALRERGIEPGDRVCVLANNSHVMLEAHNGIPMAGAVIVPLNTRLSADELCYIVEHCQPALLIVTENLSPQAGEVARRCGVEMVIGGSEDSEYEQFLAAATPTMLECADERSMLAINYTSGTTGRPKGAMYHHRGAYLQSLAMALHNRLTTESVYLWTLPMFHCDGWCFTWAVTAAGATHLCLRSFDPGEVWRLVRTAGVTHFSAAPTVLTALVSSPAAERSERSISVTTGGAPPTPTLLASLDALNLDVTHLYGMTETFGPIIINDWQPQWNEEEVGQRSARKARQGVPNVIAEQMRVVGTEGNDVLADGASIGELILRGNDLFMGYYRDDDETNRSSFNSYFRTGDLGVMYADGYLELRDRAKDIIISGGENISSVEVERVLDSHPAVLESGVVALPDETWGEVPVAVVTLREGHELSEGDLIGYVRDHLAHFKAPKRVIFADLPKTSTGKVQKHLLRSELRSRLSSFG
ncbi:MAG: AMP-binding protein [Acidimicrobiaceae bacterium]|nr:AMP-binding protein [Acidimicrobiaceae bacterium]MBO0746932.1 AMP-binding protein [Acidimicrobiaceae bacterium]